MTLLFANNAYNAPLAGPITTTSTTISLGAGTGAQFPNPTAPDYFKLTLVDAATGLRNEIVHVTARSTDTLTVVRAQENTTAQNWLAGDLASNLWTAGSAGAMLQKTQQSSFYEGSDTASDPNNLTVPTVVPALTAAPAVGQLFFVVKGQNANTGAVNLLISPGTSQAVVYANGDPLSAGDWPGSSTMLLYYTGGVYQVVSRLLSGARFYVGSATGGTATALTTTLTPTPPALLTGICMRVPISTTNGASPTLDFGFGPKPVILNTSGVALGGSEMPGANGYVADLLYDGTSVRLSNPNFANPLNNVQLVMSTANPTTVPNATYTQVMLKLPSGVSCPFGQISGGSLTIKQPGLYSLNANSPQQISASGALQYQLSAFLYRNGTNSIGASGSDTGYTPNSGLVGGACSAITTIVLAANDVISAQVYIGNSSAGSAINNCYVQGFNVNITRLG